jgi:rhodanese-related sulfurtransferase
MNIKNSFLVILILGILCSLLVSCGNGASAGKDNTNEFEVIRAAADKFLAGGRAEEYIMTKDLHDILNDTDLNNDPRIMETRNNNTYTVGHICGAINTPWHQLFTTLDSSSMEKYFQAHDARSTDKQIAIVSYTGQEGGGLALAVLNMLGWDAIKLKWGYNQWQWDSLASPGTFYPANTGLGRVTGLNTSGAAVSGFWAVGQNYPTETTANTATQTYPFPVVNNTDSADTFEIIRAAANQVALKETPVEKARAGSEQKHKWQPTDIIPEDLLSSMNGSTPPFILSVQPRELYDKGHIQGAVWMDIKTACQPDNLKLLPTDRQIAVVSNDGQSGTAVAAILNMLGYDAVNLLFGMTAWTFNKDIAPGRFECYENDMATFKDVLAYEVCWTDVPVAEAQAPIEGYVPPVTAPVEDPNNSQSEDMNDYVVTDPNNPE